MNTNRPKILYTPNVKNICRSFSHQEEASSCHLVIHAPNHVFSTIFSIRLLGQMLISVTTTLNFRENFREKWQFFLKNLKNWSKIRPCVIWTKFRLNSCWIYSLFIQLLIESHVIQKPPTSRMCTVICLHSSFRLFHSLPFPSLTHTHTHPLFAVQYIEWLPATHSQANEWESQRVKQNQPFILNVWVTFFNSDIFYYGFMRVCVSVSLRTLWRKEEEKITFLV